MESNILLGNNLILLIVLFFLSCKSPDKELDMYKNSVKMNIDKGINNIRDTFIAEQKFELKKHKLNSISIFSKVENDDEKYTNLENYILYNQNKYFLSTSFENDTNYTFKYSNFGDDFLLNEDYKIYKVNELNILFIKGYNPFCNGSHCTSYYIFVIVLDSEKIKEAKLFHFDSSKIAFETIKIEKKNSKIRIISKKSIIGTLIL